MSEYTNPNLHASTYTIGFTEDWALPDVMRAAKDGWITMDHAELMAASHGRAPMNTDEQLDLLAIGVQQGPDVFKATLAKWETKRLTASGLNPTE
ncbi:MAG: hypothetical protein OXE93_09730 [bacterium]|nr:hypothetical protein [bacterium]